MLACKKCGSETYVKNGIKGDKQRYRCKACGASFTEGDRRRRPHLEKIKSMAVVLYARGAMSFGQIAEFLNGSSTSVYNYVLEFAMSLPPSSIDTSVKAVEINEMHHFIGNKKKKFWIFKALDRDSCKIIAWTTSYSRGVAAVRPLIMKFEQLKDCVFYTDRWRGFRLAWLNTSMSWEKTRRS